MSNDSPGASRFPPWVTHALKWLLNIGSVGVVAGLVLFGLQYCAAPRNARVAEAAQLRREVVKEQYFDLKRVLRFSELGLQAAVLVAPQVWIGKYGTNTTRMVDEKGLRLKTIRLVSEPEIYEEWRGLREEIEKAKPHIDPDVYGAFQDVCNMADVNPFPSLRDDMETFEQSGWTRSPQIAHWFTLNKYLKLRVRTYLALED